MSPLLSLSLKESCVPMNCAQQSNLGYLPQVLRPTSHRGKSLVGRLDQERWEVTEEAWVDKTSFSLPWGGQTGRLRWGCLPLPMLNGYTALRESDSQFLIFHFLHFFLRLRWSLTMLPNRPGTHDPPASTSLVSDITRMCYYTWWVLISQVFTVYFLHCLSKYF